MQDQLIELRAAPTAPSLPEQRAEAAITVAVPYDELCVATSSFGRSEFGFDDSNALLGEGGFGAVYGASSVPSIPRSGACAVKRLSADSMQGQAELMTEIRILSTCQHEFLLPLLGFCLDAATVARYPPRPSRPSARASKQCLVYPLMRGVPS